VEKIPSGGSAAFAEQILKITLAPIGIEGALNGQKGVLFIKVPTSE
jgi:hypothetical protein